MPEPKRSDCFPPAVSQSITMGSSMESVHTAMSPRKTEFGSVRRITSLSPWCVCIPAKMTDDTIAAHMCFRRLFLKSLLSSPSRNPLNSSSSDVRAYASNSDFATELLDQGYVLFGVFGTVGIQLESIESISIACS